MKKITLLFISPIFLISCKSEFEKNVQNYSENKIFLNSKDNFVIKVIKIDSLTRSEVKIEKFKEEQNNCIANLKLSLEEINNNKILIEKIKDAKIVKPNKVNLYAFKNEEYGKENAFYEITWNSRVATTKEKDIAEINKQINNKKKHIEHLKNQIANFERQINKENSFKDNDLENFKVHTDFFLKDKIMHKYIFTLDNNKNVIESKKTF